MVSGCFSNAYYLLSSKRGWQSTSLSLLYVYIPYTLESKLASASVGVY